MLTFDGPHTGWFEYVIPLLKEREFPATFFVIAGWVGSQHRFPESRYLTWDDIAGIERCKVRSGRQLFDVGSHSMWHTTLDMQPGENGSKYHQRLHEEIVKATTVMRERTGLPVRTYAAPKGKGDLASLRKRFELAGIQAVRWASLPGKSNQYQQDLFDLQISYCDTVHQSWNQMAFMLSNKYLSFLKKCSQWLISRVARIGK
jgi:peptidoglycan/xylan/chitin deacetylase (PgdA/CDA1 family)